MTTRRVALAALLATLTLPAASAAAANTWEGVWNSDFGRMTLSASGSGSYEGFSPGTVSGKVTGNVNEGTWHQPGDPPKEGTYKFTLGFDGKSFSGVWAYKQGGCGSACGWNGTCIEGACLKNGTAPATPPKDAPPQIVPAPDAWCSGGGSAARRALAKLPCQTDGGPIEPGQGAIVASPPLAQDQNKATVVVATTEANFVDHLTGVLTGHATPRLRLLFCVNLYRGLTGKTDDLTGKPVEASLSDQSLAVLVVGLCLKIAADLNDKARSGNKAALAAASSCSAARIQTPVRIRRSGSKYTGRAKGKTRRVGRSPLLVSCTRTANSLTLNVRTRSRKTKLRSVVGRRLNVGIYNDLEASGAAAPSIAFARP